MPGDKGRLMSALNYLREIIWPLLEGPEPPRPSIALCSFRPPDELDESVLERAYDLSWRLYEAEENRLATINNKSSLLATVGAAAVAIVPALTAWFYELGNGSTVTAAVSLGGACIAMVYLITAVFHATRALDLRGRHALQPKDAICPAPVSRRDYTARLIALLGCYTVRNYHSTNRSADYYRLAQAYFKRGLFVTALIGVLSVATTLVRLLVHMR
ncbi:MAG: hypothetical protein QHH27_01750 [Clostridia bacterium]|jgi:hypothetical protein|nr:hypothetical protein [Clostridia bacterium]MDH7572261.1 hypothetical protein [Clostridia bacterium]